MDEFRLLVSTEAYQMKIDTLSDHLGALKEHLSDYHEMKNSASTVLRSSELTLIQRTIDGQIKKVEDMIASVEKQILTLKNLVSDYDDLGENVKTILETAVDIFL